MSRSNLSIPPQNPLDRRWRPSPREAFFCFSGLALWLTVTALFIGLRAEHFFLALLLAALFCTSSFTRRLAVALLPFLIFGISYDWMNMLPNYEVNPVDTDGIYNLEKSLFGITLADGSRLTPNEFFAIVHHPVADFFAGIFYLCWVPLPIIFGLWLYFRRRTEPYLHFALVFLFVNLLGFTLYYIHPAAPPWYVALHGFEPVPGTPGDVAGLGRFDAMTGTSVFHALYGRNANVFAALPSLHSAYTLIALIYSLRYRCPAWWRIILAIVTAGIWTTAVYTSHHYLIDVLAGIATAFAGYFIFEGALMRIPSFARFIRRYSQYISLSPTSKDS